MFEVILDQIFSLLPLGLPGGNQVDGLPPAASPCANILAITYFQYRKSLNLQPAVNRQPGYRRGDREVVVKKTL